MMFLMEEVEFVMVKGPMENVKCEFLHYEEKEKLPYEGEGVRLVFCFEFDVHANGGVDKEKN